MRRPDERFRTFVVTVDVSADGRDQFFRIAEDTATEAVLSVARDADVRMAPAIKQKVVCTIDAGRCCVPSGQAA